MGSRVLMLLVFAVGFIRTLITQFRFRTYLGDLISRCPGFLPGVKEPVYFKTGVEFKMMSFLYKRRYQGLADANLRERGERLRRRCMIDTLLGCTVLLLCLASFAFTANDY
ncbi:TPA: hypothetical protein ACKP22_000286 [Pseudomonas putida]